MLHPPDAADQSYAESYARSKNLPFHMPMSHSTKAILTDRGQYMNYLEAQLERVTASLLSHGTLEKRIVDVDETVSKLDDRIQSITKVARLSQVRR